MATEPSIFDPSIFDQAFNVGSISVEFSVACNEMSSSVGSVSATGDSFFEVTGVSSVIYTNQVIVWGKIDSAVSVESWSVISSGSNESWTQISKDPSNSWTLISK